MWFLMIMAAVTFTASNQAQGYKPSSHCLTEEGYNDYYTNIISMTEDIAKKDLAHLKEEVGKIKENQARLEKIVNSTKDSISSLITNICSNCCTDNKTTESPETTVEPTTEQTTTPKECSTDGMITIGNESFKVFIGEKYSGYSYTQAQQKCHSENMIMAEPQDPVAVTRYLIRHYGGTECDLFWYGAREDSQHKFYWTHGGGEIPANSSYWVPRHGPEQACKLAQQPSGCCILTFTRQPFQSARCSGPYSVSRDCTNAICQCPSA